MTLAAGCPSLACVVITKNEEANIWAAQSR